MFIHQLIFFNKMQHETEAHMNLFLCSISNLLCAALHFDGLIKVKTNQYPETGGDRLKAGGRA
jgi:hypothetical protein